MTEAESDNQSTHDSPRSGSEEIIFSGNEIALSEYEDGRTDSEASEETTDMEDDAEVSLQTPSNAAACQSCQTRNSSIRTNQREAETTPLHDSGERKG